MKKIIGCNFIFACLVFVLCLSGCGHTHTWEEATVVSPKECTVCGETEGVSLFEDADTLIEGLDLCFTEDFIVADESEKQLILMFSDSGYSTDNFMAEILIAICLMGQSKQPSQVINFYSMADRFGIAYLYTDEDSYVFKGYTKLYILEGCQNEEKIKETYKLFFETLDAPI